MSVDGSRVGSTNESGGRRSPMATSLSCSSKGRPRRTTASTTEKMAVVAPTPRATTINATAVNVGVERSERMAAMRSARMAAWTFGRRWWLAWQATLKGCLHTNIVVKGCLPRKDDARTM